MKLFILLLLSVIVLAKDYYKILDIGKDADDKTIKAAYRRLSKQYHPDKNPSDDAHEKFIEIGEAYEVLSDETKRKNYDTYGDPNAGPDDSGVDLGDLFNQFFGGHGGSRGGGQRRVRKGESKQLNVKLPLQYFYTGHDMDFEVEMKNICTTCDGTGSKDKQRQPCGKCGGHGIVTMKRQFGPGMFQQFQVQCDACGGKGSTIKHKCHGCQGLGVVDTMRQYNVYIKPGAKRHDKIVLEGEGDASPDWVPGDIIVNIVEDYTKNWGYRRIGNNLYRTEVLTLAESTLGGWHRTIKFFDTIDHDIELSRKPGEMIINGHVDIIKGKGMPIDDDHGDLFIEYKVLIPESPMIKDEL